MTPVPFLEALKGSKELRSGCLIFWELYEGRKITLYQRDKANPDHTDSEEKGRPQQGNVMKSY